MKSSIVIPVPTVIMGLGNPGSSYYKTRHSIGYRVVDALADRFGGIWRDRGDLQIADITINDRPVILVKSNTYMNDSGKAIPCMLKKGVEPANILVVHDELEKPFGALSFKIDGSHRGHNGLRSIINVCGAGFARLRFGIGRPNDQREVPDYVLKPFGSDETKVPDFIDQAVVMIEDLYK